MTSTTATKTKPKPSTLTPMMQQYMQVKEAHPDCLLFYRMGDFYELFFEDALVAAKVLDIALTKRGKHDSQDIPMCGVPHHSSDSYLEKLIRHGHKVAICEQMESPEEAKKRGYKAVVKRDVIRIVTPGTLTEDALLDAKQANYLVAVTRTKKQFGLAWLDMSTGEFITSTTDQEQLSTDLARLNPKELLIAEDLHHDIAYKLEDWKSRISIQVSSFFEVLKAENRLKHFYQVQTLDGLGAFEPSQIAACGALLEYIDLTQKGTMPHLKAPKLFMSNQIMQIDAATRKNLELTQTLSGEHQHSLFATINRTVTGAGARLLHANITSPLASSDAINKRLDKVAFFVEESDIREQVRDLLSSVPDIERAASRVVLRRGSPRDMGAIRVGLLQAQRLAEYFIVLQKEGMPKALLNLSKPVEHIIPLLDKLQKSLRDELPFLAREGGFIREGYHTRLDELDHLCKHSKEKIQSLQEQYRNQTEVASLKVKQNNVIGMYIEVTSQHQQKMDPEIFMHKQTMASAMRFTTSELQQLEQDLASAAEQMLAIELDIFEQLTKLMSEAIEDITLIAASLAGIDVMSALAHLATEYHYTRPEVDDSLAFTIEGGRHPVVEATLKNQQERFIANDCNVSESQRLWLLTGPNMAGKSTFLRQNAIIALMAQMGSFVPAAHAHIGVIDRLFSRVGAADDLARGRSTFMVEMVETATILNQATRRSFVILDEIGRGTSTYDGLSIAWATLEYLHNHVQTRALFATHYHELTELPKQLPHLACYCMRVREWEGKVIFMHEVITGAAGSSYGIHVAQLAGLPSAVTERANQLLQELQQKNTVEITSGMQEQLPLFTHTPKLEVKPSEVEEELKSMDIDALSPRQALDMLYGLKGKVV